ncbi:phage holin family protein [Streptomyces sp. S3(2020)]|uniref:phage holin family protein n=1 Tax=Streptomyces sp. S3(2020) TaxID=2732044 RepID=UPI0014881FDB|nr:phage holin family protein [Streptomyces sp. S3(2020)]NNN33285.1 phage holin family protein [Streptomyces sp. S3(2020)]
MLKWYVVGYLLLVPVVVPGFMAAQSPPQHVDGAARPVLAGISLLTAVVVAWAAGRGQSFRWWLPLARAAVLLGLCAAAVALTRSQLEPGALRATMEEPADPYAKWMVTSMLEIPAAGLTAMVFFLVVRWWGRQAADSPGRPRRPRPPSRPTLPEPGEIWLAMVPYREGTGEESQHYCVVVSCHEDHAGVLQITSQNKDARRDHIRIPNDGWDEVSGKDHWMEIDVPLREVPYEKFLTVSPQGRCPATTWGQIQAAHPTQLARRPDHPAPATVPEPLTGWRKLTRRHVRSGSTP